MYYSSAPFAIACSSRSRRLDVRIFTNCFMRSKGLAILQFDLKYFFIDELPTPVPIN